MSDLQLYPWQRCKPAFVAPSFSCRMSPATLIYGLPLLGKVLYLSRPSAVCLCRLPAGLLAEQWTLWPLLHTCWLAYASVITSEGPREWLDCLDAKGDLCARLYLLPETDYLAWDALLASGSLAPLPGGFRGSMTTPAGAAQVLNFRWRRLAGLQSIGCDPAHGLSSVSEQFVRHVVGVESQRALRP